MNKNPDISSPLIAWITLFIVLLVNLVLLFTSQGVYGGADSYNHYLISKFAFAHPELLLDHWGKPLFTLITSPFSQFGFKGLILFNIILNLLTAYLAYLIAKKMNYKYAFLAIPMVSFAPIFFITSISGLTEIFAAFMIMLSLYLIVKDKYIFATILFSFLPLIRTELIFLFPILLLFLAFRKRYLALPFILTGIVLYSLIGGIYYGDYFWLYTQTPYKGARGIYGSGGLLYYVRNYKNLVERIITILFLLGLIKYVWDQYKKPTLILKKYNLEKLLILMLIIIFGAAHSYAWWKGIGGAYGLLRLMAVITPLIAFMALEGVSFFFEIFKIKERLKSIIVLVLGIFIIVIPFLKFELPVKMEPNQKLIKEIANYTVENEDPEKIYYYDPVFAHFAGIDPYNEETSVWGITNPEDPGLYLTDGDLLVWDSHFGPNEGKTPFEKVSLDSTFVLLKEVRTMLDNDVEYSIYLYKVTDSE